MMRLVRFLLFYLVAVLYAAIAQADDSCEAENKALKTPPPIEIDMQTPLGFVVSIVKARQEITKAIGKTKKPLTCYKTKGWTMRIIRPDPNCLKEDTEADAKQRRLGPKKEESKKTGAGAKAEDTKEGAGSEDTKKVAPIQRDFPLENDIYIKFQDKDTDHTYPEQSPFDWDLEKFDLMLRTPKDETPKDTIRRNVYLIAEAIRFDWVRNRIAAALVFEAKHKGLKAAFSVPKTELLNAWKLEDKALAVPESVAKQKHLSAFAEQWDNLPEDAKAPTFCDDFTVTTLEAGQAKGKCESGWTEVAILFEGLRMAERTKKDHAQLTKEENEATKAMLTDRIQRFHAKATKIHDTYGTSLKEKLNELDKLPVKKGGCKTKADAQSQQVTDMKDLIKKLETAIKEMPELEVKPKK